MSYEIHAFLPVAGEDPLDTGMRLAFNRDKRLGEGLLTGDSKAAELTQTLKRLWPVLQEVRYDRAVVDGEGSEFPAGDEIQIDLVLADEESGTQIEIGERVVHISIPFTLSPAAAQAVFGQIWDCLSGLQRERGYLAYDPQIDQILTFSDDLPIALRHYVKMLRYLPGMVEIESAITKPQEENQGSNEIPWYRRS